MNQLALATYQFELGLDSNTREPRQQSLIQTITTILETPVQTIAKIIDGDDELSDWG